MKFRQDGCGLLDGVSYGQVNIIIKFIESKDIIIMESDN